MCHITNLNGRETRGPQVVYNASIMGVCSGVSDNKGRGQLHHMNTEGHWALPGVGRTTCVVTQ